MRISSTLNRSAGNFARPTKFNMILTPPPLLSLFQGETLDVLCKTVDAPSVSNEAYEIKIKGHPLKIPARTVQNQEITITFYVDEYYKVRGLFQDWINALDNRNPVPRNIRSEAVSKSWKYGSIELIGRDFNETLGKPISFIFEDVFPIQINDLNFDSSNKDSVTEMSVTFAYYRYRTNNDIFREVIENHDNYLD